jgi:hypothetical protein
LFSVAVCGLNKIENEKQETTDADFCTWVEKDFLDSFLDWIKGKIISRIPDQDRVMFEMTCPADSIRGKTHVQAIVHKGFPLPAFVSRTLVNNSRRCVF